MCGDTSQSCMGALRPIVGCYSNAHKAASVRVIPAHTSPCWCNRPANAVWQTSAVTSAVLWSLQLCSGFHHCYRVWHKPSIIVMSLCLWLLKCFMLLLELLFLDIWLRALVRELSVLSNRTLNMDQQIQATNLGSATLQMQYWLHLCLKHTH